MDPVCLASVEHFNVSLEMKKIGCQQGGRYNCTHENDIYTLLKGIEKSLFEKMMAPLICRQWFSLAGSDHFRGVGILLGGSSLHIDG